MINATDARQRTEEQKQITKAEHLKWFMTRAEQALNAAIAKGQFYAEVDTADLYIYAVADGVRALREAGY